MAPDDLQIGRRASPRVRVHLPATLVTTDASAPCIIENISAGGARVHLGRVPQTGISVYIMCGGMELFGTVACALGQRCGIWFDHELTPAVVVAIRRFADDYAVRMRAEAEQTGDIGAGGSGLLPRKL